MPDEFGKTQLEIRDEAFMEVNAVISRVRDVLPLHELAKALTEALPHNEERVILIKHLMDGLL